MENTKFSLDKFRVLLTQDCNLNCLYCHKEGQFHRREKISEEEFKGLTKIACEFGLEEVKYSGGEPLLYPGIGRLIQHSKDLGIKLVSLTTNGILLKERLPELKSAGLDELSISLDTLDQETYSNLNQGRREDLQKILNGIKTAKDYLFPKINLNMTLTKYNEDEVKKMISFSKDLDIPLRLISFIPLGEVKKKLASHQGRVLAELGKSVGKVITNPQRPAYTQLYLKNGGIVELVNSSCFDCASCGQSYALRLTSDGKLKPCLISEKNEVDVISWLRKGKEEIVRKKFIQTIAIKKLGLMSLADIPVRELNREYLVEE